MPNPMRALPRGTGASAGPRSYAGGSTQHVLGRDDRLYHGRFHPDSPFHPKGGEDAAEQLYRDWHKGNTNREKNIAVDQQNRAYYRRSGRQLAGIGVGTFGASVGAGELARAKLQRENKDMRAKLAKGWSRKDPLMWMAESRGGAHRVTIMGEKPPWEKPLSRMERLGREVHQAGMGNERSSNRLQAGAAAVTGVAGLTALARTKGPAEENQRLTRKIAAVERRNRRRKPVAKRSNDRQNQRNEGAAMRAAGVGTAAVGLVGGGIPGVREPDGNKVWLTRGKTKQQRAAVARGEDFPSTHPTGNKSPLHPRNIGHNAKTLGSLPRAGILGFRANVHDGAVKDHKNLPPTRDKVELGRRAGFLEAEKNVTRGMRIARRGTYGLTIGGAGLAAAGHRKMKDEPAKVGKRDRFEEASATALGGGAAAAAAGTAVPAGLKHFSRKTSNSAKKHVLAAQKLHPPAGGLKTIPEQRDPTFGTVIKPAKQTSHPEVSTRDINFGAASDKVRHEVGRHRGIATQERYFSAVMDKTGKQFKRLRGPGLAVAGAGAAGLAGSRGKQAAEERFGKAVTYGYQERRRNKHRTAYQVGGAALVAGGASHLQVGPQVSRGVKLAEAKGYGRQARQARDVVRVGRNEVRRTSGQAVGALRGRVPGLGTALDVIPAKLRPHAAIGAGALLAARGTPAHDVRFVPTGRF